LLTLLSSNLFGLRSLGAIIGFVDAMLAVGAALGPLVAGLIFDLTGSYGLAFLICTLVCVIAMVVMVPLRPAKEELPSRR